MVRELLRDRWIRWILAHHKLVLLVGIVVTLAAGWCASRLYVDTDLRRLLPTDHPVVTNLEAFEESFGTTGSVNVVVTGGTVAGRRKFADALAERLNDHPLLDEVDYRLPSRFFAEHALYYLSPEEMERLRELVDGWIHYEYCSEAPDVCVEAPDPAAPESLREFVEAKREESAKRTGFRDYYEREGIEALVVLLQPIKSSSDLEFAQEIDTTMREVVADVFARPGAPWSKSDLRYNIVGPYTVKAEGQATIHRDMVRSGAFAIIGVVLIVYLLFRSVRALFILLIPLLCGVTWSLGATQLVLGHLNSMTSLISTVVMGVGIDAGIHFFSRARRNRRHHGDHDSVRLAFHGLVVPLLVATSTTMAAFLVMASSRFPAFHEFGIIAAMGVALCLLSMVTVLPALAVLVGVKPAPARKGDEQVGWAARFILARPGVLFAVLVVLTVVSFQGVRRVQFEYNGRTLQSDQARAATEVDSKLISTVFGKDIHASVLIVPTPQAAREAVDRARALRQVGVQAGESVVAQLFSVVDLLPPPEVDPEQRAQEIEELREDLPERALERIEKGEARGDGRGEGNAKALRPEDVRQLRNMLAAKPFGLEDLPQVVLNKIRSPGGQYAIFAYPDFDAADIRKGMDFMEETAKYVGPDDGMFVGETTVYVAMYQMLQKEAPVIFGMAFVLIAALVFWQFRSLSYTLMTLVPLGLALWWLVALMGAMGVKFTLFNLPLLPAVLGIGVDNGVYLMDRIRRTHGERNGLARSLHETGGAILAATATTMVGFAAFVIADSGGVRSIGTLAVLGIACAAAAAVLVLPTITALARRPRGTPSR